MGVWVGCYQLQTISWSNYNYSVISLLKIIFANGGTFEVQGPVLNKGLNPCCPLNCKQDYNKAIGGLDLPIV